jgi:DNA-binding beta-propeller fold protein YncE
MFQAGVQFCGSMPHMVCSGRYVPFIFVVGCLSILACGGQPHLSSTRQLRRRRVAEDADAGVGARRRPTVAYAADGGVPRSRIGEENARAGTSAWQLSRPARNHEVEGFASLTSAAAGESVQLRVHVDHPKAVHWELYRMGHYQGLGGRFIASAPARMIVPQSPCEADPGTGLVECVWDDAFDVQIEAAWVSGQYFFKLIDEEGHDSYVPLIVRERADDARAAVVFQSSIATWQAYNSFGGSSLYRNNLPPEVGFTGKQAEAVSFDRPYGCPTEDAQCVPGESDFDLGERWMARWLEERGVDLAYVTTLDVASHPELLEGRKLFLSVGHDEYWPVAERDALDGARDAGVSLGFFGANTGYWRVRIADSSRGEPLRTVFCYKEARDPRQNARDTTSMFRRDPMPRPEGALIGLSYDENGARTNIDGFAEIVRRPDHWVYEGTGVRDGDVLAHVIGYEWDSLFDNMLAPKGLESIAHAQLFNVRGAEMPADIAVYTPTPTSVVFAAGSVFWANALSRPEYVDPRIERMTENVLARAGVTGLVPTVVPPHSQPTAASSITLLAGSGEIGQTDGSAVQARFDTPVGIAAGPHGELYVSDGRLHAIRVISGQGQVSTLAGCGTHGSRDGDGSDACFDQPGGMATGANGTIYVADTMGQRIRTVTPSGHVSTFAGSGKRGSDDAADPLAARFSEPRALAFGPDGALYVAESGTGLIRKIDRAGVSRVTQVAQATGIAVGPDGTLYIVDERSATISQFKGGQLSTLAGQPNQFGDRDGPVGEARLRPSEGIQVDGDRLVFSDAANHKLRAVQLSDGSVSTLAGADGTANDLEAPRGLARTSVGFVVADSGHHRVVLVASPAASGRTQGVRAVR